MSLTTTQMRELLELWDSLRTQFSGSGCASTLTEVAKELRDIVDCVRESGYTDVEQMRRTLEMFASCNKRG